MNKPTVIYHEKIALDLSKIKCIKLVSKSVRDVNRILIEFKTRYEYVFNPNTGVYDKEKIDDFTELIYPEYDMARMVVIEFKEIWQDFLDENLKLE